jgi:nitrogenase subunit NifH
MADQADKLTKIERGIIVLSLELRKDTWKKVLAEGCDTAKDCARMDIERIDDIIEKMKERP